MTRKILFVTLLQVTFLSFDQFFDQIVLPFQWTFTIFITICIFIKQRRESVYIFKKFKSNHDLLYQEVMLNHSLQQILFVIKIIYGLIKNYFEVFFPIKNVKKNLHKLTTFLRELHKFQEQIFNNYKGSTGEQINIVDKPVYLNQILYQYIANYQNKEMYESLPLKLTGLQNNQTFNILVSPCIWKHEKCFIISLINLTDRIKISQLEKLDQYKESVLAILSHDLKNPINVIQSMITLVQEGLYELLDFNNVGVQLQIQSCCNYLQMCQTNVQTLQSFVNDLQDFAQIKQQKLKLVVIQFEIYNLIQEIKNVFQIQFQKKNLELDIQVKLKLNQIYQNDPLRIKQITVKFSDDIQKIIQFCNTIKEQIDSIKSIVDPGILFKNKFKIFICKVTDNESGMSLDIQHGVFRHFATYENQSNINHVGLSLIICRQLCGYIGPIQYMYLRSQAGVGTTFQFAIYKNYDIQHRYDYSEDQSSIDSIDYDISVQSPYKNISPHVTQLLYTKNNKGEMKHSFAYCSNCNQLKLVFIKWMWSIMEEKLLKSHRRKYMTQYFWMLICLTLVDSSATRTSIIQMGKFKSTCLQVLMISKLIKFLQMPEWINSYSNLELLLN
ncbi:unnamed protein product [Paramecium sonneborni]|uniref:Histidine kinase domain-containing protein n=1 Tax=Paramecium sonneborni TaxID=65129 RepID=A0A8S1R7B0_9CILI|nr:unnamed protein product [Paramecium sonneborni]